MILAVSRFRVANGLEPAVAAGFADLPGLVDAWPGFLGLETFTDTALTISGPEAPLRVSVDVSRMPQVLVNILSNAMKYTSAGGAIVVSTIEAHHFEKSLSGRGFIFSWKVCLCNSMNGVDIRSAAHLLLLPTWWSDARSPIVGRFLAVAGATPTSSPTTQTAACKWPNRSHGYAPSLRPSRPRCNSTPRRCAPSSTRSKL